MAQLMPGADLVATESAMKSMLPSADPSEYLSRLMHAGQDAVRQFDDALASAIGVKALKRPRRGACSSRLA